LAPLNLPLPIYVVSDLHLSGADQATEQLFSALIDPQTCQAKSLVLLGDLFDVWLGDDAIGTQAAEMAAKLRQLSERGVDIYFVPGNRDFLLGDAYSTLAGMRKVDEPLRLAAPWDGVAMIHGDLLCQDDLAYQQFRKRTRNKKWQKQVLGLPVFVRRAIARFARWKSQRHGATLAMNTPTIADVTPSAVHSFVSQYSLTHLIHGHTHRMGIHNLVEPKSTRWVLGDWAKGVGSVLVLNEQSIGLYRIALSGDGKNLSWSQTGQQLAH